MGHPLLCEGRDSEKLWVRPPPSFFLVQFFFNPLYDTVLNSIRFIEVANLHGLESDMEFSSTVLYLYAHVS